MAKRGTLTHRRTRRLAGALDVPLPYALGLMEALWHVTAEHAPAGDVGRMTDQDLCDELYWNRDAGELIEAFVRAGVLERHSVHRLVVHGWSEHADNALRHKLKRAGSMFWDGQPPFGHRELPSAHGQTASDHDQTGQVADRSCSDEIEPASNQQPVPATSASASNQQPTDNDPPLAPPAARVGTGAGEDIPPALDRGSGRYACGDLLPDGREVLEVDTGGHPTVVKRGPGSPPTLTQEAHAAVERIVAFASKALGHRFDRAGRRRLRERLLGGESEEQILAAYRAQVTALEELEAAGAAEDDGDDAELDQALRLAGAAPPGALAAAGRVEP